MGKINVLSFAVANLIAAGEVVDRPASVIKELMENAIDSGADRITVEIQNGGVVFMRVSDNGGGIEKDDLPVAIRRHATSKIRDAADLDGIMTLGFRGEALAAIAAVSDLRIISRPRGAENGAAIEVSGGDILGVSERGCSEGTSVIVENLFGNVPARRKFLKRDVTETAAVAAAVEKVALSNPGIAFRFIADGAEKLETAGDGKLLNTIYAIYGREFAKSLIEVNYEYEGIRVSGYTGRSDNIKPNRNGQSFYINGRYVKSRTVAAALEQAYCSYMPPERFPVCTLFIELNPRAVDVNVHPAKLEVKFSNEKPVFEAVYYGVRNALESNTTRPDIPPEKLSHMTYEEYKKLFGQAAKPPENGSALTHEGRSAESAAARETPRKPAETTVHDAAQSAPERIKPRLTAADYAEDIKNAALSVADKTDAEYPGDADIPDTAKQSGDADIPDTQAELPEVIGINGIDEASRDKNGQYTAGRDSLVVNGEGKNRDNTDVQKSIGDDEKIPAYRIIGEAFNSYVIVETGDKLLLVDKHAAHERIIFEKLKAGLKESRSHSQILMLPLEFMLTSDEVTALREYGGEIERIGFEFTAEKYTVRVTQVPETIDLTSVPDIFMTIADRVRSETGSAGITRDIIFEKALYQASCKAAIKAGREYGEEHIKWLIEKLMELPDITFCPHGRPVAMELNKGSLDRQFKRT